MCDSKWRNAFWNCTFFTIASLDEEGVTRDVATSKFMLCKKKEMMVIKWISRDHLATPKQLWG